MFGEKLQENGMNPYVGMVLEQGVVLDVPGYLKDLSKFPLEVTQPDRLTGIARETDRMRQYLVKQLKDTITKGNKWVCLYVDGDQLKTANNSIGRDFGDVFIKWTTASSAQAIDQLQEGLKSKVIAVRPEGGSDEVAFWFFDITESDLTEIEKAQRSISKQQVQLSNPKFTFSASSCLIHNSTKDLEKEVNNTKRFLKEQPNKLPWSLYREVGNLANSLTKTEKLNKDLAYLASLTTEQLLQSPDLATFMGILRGNYGGMRISDEILEIILKLQSVETVMALKNRSNRKTYQEMLKELGINEDALFSAKSEQELTNLFKRLFG